MPVNLTVPEQVHPVAGVTLAAVAAGVKNNGQPDLVLISLPQSCNTAGVFTRNAYCAAPVKLCRQHLQLNQGKVRALLVNSGGANAATGAQGDANALSACEHVAQILGIEASAVLPFSTGVIGEQLPMDKIASGIASLGPQLSDANWHAAARGIMTTDILPKMVSRTVSLSSGVITLTGFAKGSGMIEPDMATMLAYLFTDAAVEQQALQSCLQQATERSFNSITVDGDTSTNDSYLLCATGQAQSAGDRLTQQHPDWPVFCEAVNSVSLALAQAVVRDGEGASKFISIRVTGAASEQDARRVGLTVGNSPLVKTAFYASDANLGRIIMAVGRSGVTGLDIDTLTLKLGDVDVLQRGQPASDYTEERGAAVMARDEIDVSIDLGCGSADWTVYACDFSHDYVSINADYRS